MDIPQQYAASGQPRGHEPQAGKAFHDAGWFLLPPMNGVVAGRYERRVMRTIGPSPTEASPTTKLGA
jgi:hypothetical protein